MSYDINFWKYKPGVSLDNQSTYETLSEGRAVEGVEELPIHQTVARLKDGFAHWQQIDDVTWDSDTGGFQSYTTPKFEFCTFGGQDCYR